MPYHSFDPRFFVLTCGLYLLATLSAFAGPRDAVMLNTELEPEFVRILTITDEYVEVDLGSSRSRALSLDRYLAVLFADSAGQADVDHDGGGLLFRDIRPDEGAGQLRLTDGQRYIGRLLAEAGLPDGVVAWSHPVLGRLEFKLDDVRSLMLPGARGTASTDLSRTEPALADTIVLRNGDELRGFIISINDPIEVELSDEDGNGAGRIVELPMDRVASVSMIAPSRAAVGSRLWLTDGTIMAVLSLTMPEDGRIEVTGRWHGAGTQALNLPREVVAAWLCDAKRVAALSSIAPMRVDGPPTRYLVSDPVVLDDSPLLGISRIEYRGPVTVHYALPAGAKRFAAEAVLPRESRMWGEIELVIRIDGRVVERREINGDNPAVSINTSAEGSELTIELREGESGPVQNHLVLSRAILLLEK